MTEVRNMDGREVYLVWELKTWGTEKKRNTQRVTSPGLMQDKIHFQNQEAQ